MSSGTAVFISYRHNDTFAVAHRLKDTLIQCLGQGTCYLDTEDRGYGSSIPDAIFRHLEAAKVLLALIGSSWLEEKDQDGDRRLRDCHDYVRQEIEFARCRNKLIIPVLVGRVDFKKVKDWLERKVPSLAFLADLRRYEIESERLDLQRLLDSLSEATGIAARQDYVRSVVASNVNALAIVLAKQFPLPRRFATANAEAPFVGLRHFAEEDTPLFFGRTSETLTLCRSVKHFGLVLLYGHSGVGKSSLLHAGLLPRLGDLVPSTYLRREKSVGYHEQLISLLGEHRGQATVVVLDQLEEIYTDRRRDWRNEGSTFWDTLASALCTYPSLKFVLSFRSEYYPEIRNSLRERQVTLTDDQELHIKPLDRDGIREAIYGVAADQRLANSFRLTIDQDVGVMLSADLLDETRPESHIGPLLEYHLWKLWDDALSRRQSETDRIHFTADRYRSVRRNTLDDLLNEQLLLLERTSWQRFLANGLTLDVLHCYTTELQTAATRADKDIPSRYGHIEGFQDFFDYLKNRLLLLLRSGTRDSPSVRLAHDALAPVIRQRFQRSAAPGQLASRLVEAKTRHGGGTVTTFSESDIQALRAGWFGMSRLSTEVIAIIEADDAKYRRQKQSRLDEAIRTAKQSMEDLRFEDSLRHLQSAQSEGIADERIWDLASQLPYPLVQLGDAQVLKETMDFLGNHGLQPSNNETAANRFHPVMVRVGGGEFKMGSDEGWYPEERPVHTIHLSSFSMSATPVTWWQFGLFCRLTGRELANDAGFGRGERPVINVSWHDAVDYCIWLTERVGQVEGEELHQVYTRIGKVVSADWSKNGYRLPTEAEWEYAAREMGRTVRFGNGTDVADPAQINFDSAHELNLRTPHWYRRGRSRQSTTLVRTYPPNALGLYDMSGNVYEWCWDWWSAGEKSFYSVSEGASDPVGPVSGERRAIRGGSWLHVANLCRCTDHWRYDPAYMFNYIGFRVVRRP